MYKNIKRFFSFVFYGKDVFLKEYLIQYVAGKKGVSIEKVRFFKKLQAHTCKELFAYVFMVQYREGECPCEWPIVVLLDKSRRRISLAYDTTWCGGGSDDLKCMSHLMQELVSLSSDSELRMATLGFRMNSVDDIDLKHAYNLVWEDLLENNIKNTA